MPGKGQYITDKKATLEIIAKYKNGINCPQLAKDYGCDKYTIRRLLKRNGVLLRSIKNNNRYKVKKSKWNELILKYNSGISVENLNAILRNKPGIVKMFDWLYKDVNVFLTRKKIKADEILNKLGVA